MNGIDIEEEIPRPGLLRRLLGRPNPRHGIVEIRNLLARSPIREIADGQIADIMARYRLALEGAKPQFKAFYRLALRSYLTDHELSDDELRDLRRLRDWFGLVDEDLREIEEDLYRGALQSRFRQDDLSPEEVARLGRTADRLRLPKDVARQAFSEEASALLQRTLNTATEDHRLAPDPRRAPSQPTAGRMTHRAFAPGSRWTNRPYLGIPQNRLFLAIRTRAMLRHHPRTFRCASAFHLIKRNTTAKEAPPDSQRR